VCHTGLKLEVPRSNIVSDLFKDINTSRFGVVLDSSIVTDSDLRDVLNYR
jgi:hypothetical protein